MKRLAAFLPYQQKWFADKSRIRVWEKSRRIGASWTVAAESTFYASKRRGGCDTWYVSYNLETTREFILDCATWARAFHALIVGIDEVDELDDAGNQVLTYIIRFSTGNRITALSSNPSNLRNRKGRIVIDEAAFVPDLVETIKAALAVKMWGGRVDLLSTHNGVDSHFNKILTDTKEGRKSYSLHRTTIDEAVADGLVKRICLVLGEEWSPEFEKQWLKELLEDYGDDADEELRCVPKRSGGTYLDRMVLEGRMFDAPVFRYEAPDGFATKPDDARKRVMTDWLEKNVAQALSLLPVDLMHVFGEDFGRTADITAIAPITLKQDLHRVVPFIVELRNVPFREQEVALNFIVDRLPRFVYGALDATGNGQYMAERAWQRYGEDRIEQVNLTEKRYGEILPPMKAAFDDGLLDVPRDSDVLVDLLAFQIINGIPKLPKTRTAQKAGARKRQAPRRHGDDGIAIALAHYASTQEIGVYEYTSARKRTTTAPAVSAGATGFRRRSGGVL
jgi:phage FluMu gp28-like protein